MIVPTQEFHPETGNQHRLVLGDTSTPWAGYRSVTYLGGFVGCTAYYHAEGVHTADEWLSANSVVG